MKRIYCLALVMSLAVGCDSNDGSGGVPEAGTTGGAPEAGMTGGAPEAGVSGGALEAGVTGGAPRAGMTGGTPEAGATGGTPEAGATGGTPEAGVTGGAPEAGVTGGALEAGMTGGSPEAGMTGGVEVEGCAQSDSCIESGLCMESIDGSRCVATDESCRQSLACSGQGLCVASFDQASCVATEEGCARSAACTEEGLCGLSSDGSACALTAEGCAQLPACAAEWLCGLSSDGSECVVDISGGLGIEWVSIEGGSFMMGTILTEMGSTVTEWTTPVHSVTVIPFEITATEVTVAQYRACVDDGRCSEPGESDFGGGCNWNVEGRESYPINCVDWGQARTFAKWIGASVDLPTEAEWEYAARGGQDFIYAGSNNPDEVAWFEYNSGYSTHPVGTKQTNGYGLYDMSGNVYEWVLDGWHDNYEGAPTVSDEAWGEVPDCGQVCDRPSARRVHRGGGYSDTHGYLHVAFRSKALPDRRNGALGFRLRRTR